ncbi:hypothetical protein K501DRAFT_277200 [Backusella circina FSU 941]|nr:hypothetical protein K501DRAFT_277200 [Backusella circina FSU 941]
MVKTTFGYSGFPNLKCGDNQPHIRHQQHDSRLRIETAVPEKQLDDSPTNLSTNSTTLGSKRRGSLCRSQHSSTTKVRILAARSGEPFYRRLHHSLESVPTSVFKPTMEPHQPLSPEDTTGAITACNHDNTLVDISPLVPHIDIPQCETTHPITTFNNLLTDINSNMASNKQLLEARRVELIRSKYQNTSLNTNAQNIQVDRRLEDSSTNRSYKPGQLLFLQWAESHHISPQSFSPIDLINFLSDMYSTQSYAVSTLQLFRSAVTHLHVDPNSLRTNEDIHSFLTALPRKEPPIRLHRTTISLKPTIDYLISLSTTASFANYNTNLPFYWLLLVFFVHLIYTVFLFLRLFSQHKALLSLLKYTALKRNVTDVILSKPS